MNMNDNEPRRRWNRRSSDFAAWGENATPGNESAANTSSRARSRRSMLRFLGTATLCNREPIQITAEFRERLAAACRASAVTFTIFAVLVFSGQNILPVAWIGNVFAISVLKPTLGGTIISTKDVFVPMIPVAMISWAISVALGLLETEIYRIMLSFVVMVASLVIFLCPWPYLTMKNLMLLIFYLVVASPLSLRNISSDSSSLYAKEDLGAWFVPALVGTCSTGLAVSLLVHIVMIKAPRPTTASRQIITLARQVNHETNQLLLSLTKYIQSIGKFSDVARQSRTLIDFHVKRRRRIIQSLDEHLPAMRLENKLRISTGVNVDAIEAFVTCAKKQQKHAELVQAATTQTLLGETFTSQDSNVREVKTKLSLNLGFAIEKLALEYNKSESVYFFLDASEEDRELVIDELEHSMNAYLEAMRQAISDAETLLLNEPDASRSTTGSLIRARVTFLALFSFIHELHDVMTSMKEESDDIAPEPVPIIKQFMSCLKMEWLWKNTSKRRLAIKTAIGLSLASLWISVPYLNGHLAYPNSVWVGVTVASISLEKTGSTFTKALDRLWGTMIAAAYTLFIGKVFHVTNAIAKLLSLTFITGISTLLTNPDRPYASRYTATSVGSILYGSFDNKMEVDDYVPIRIMLIFVGVVTFLFVELLIFPRSSRTIVQAQTVQLFEDLEQFFYQSSKTCASISSISGRNTDSDNTQVDPDPLWMLRHGHKAVDVTSSLADASTAVKKTFALMKEELRPGLMEPSLGLNVSLDAIGYERLLSEGENIIVQLDLLVVTLQSLVGYYGHLSKAHPVRDLHWPSLLSASILRIAQQLSEICDEFRLVFPHGVFRPGASDITLIIEGVSKFRHFAQIRLSILADLEDRHATYLNNIAQSGEGVRYTPGFRLTLALSASAILGAAEGLQNCGRSLERIVQTFPLEDMTSSQNIGQTTTTIPIGDNDS